MKYKLLIIFIGLSSYVCMKAQDINIFADKKGTDISSSLYGIFFEEINHSGDGGLYAELVQNRSFEDTEKYPGWYVEKGKLYVRPVEHHLTHVTEERGFAWPESAIPGWKLSTFDKTYADMVITKEQPKFNTTPNNLKLTIHKQGKAVSLINSGFWGMGIHKDETYLLRTIIRASQDYNGTVTAHLLSSEGKVLAVCPVNISRKGEWNDLQVVLHATDADEKAKLVLEFNGKGVVWLDYVSLFPKNTFRNHPNGFRKDIATMLEELHPAFVRWPGGSIVGGITLDNRFDWKKTLGDPASRPGEYLTWGYRSSYGMGYYEMLQFCENIGAKAMYVCNVGLADLFRSGEACPEDSISYFINDCMDAIEYALGDTTTRWGARRAADGHPRPFPLSYVEVGNEHWGNVYDRRFDLFYKNIKKKYPQLTVISNHPLWGTDNSKKTDMVDPHWYGTPEFFFRNTTMFDSIQRGKYDVYIGEWACNFGVGKGNMRAALAEAAFITGIERNGDLVKMTSYAPLLQNRDVRNWPVNLIWFDTDSIVGRSSYYVQKMSSENRPSYNVKYEYAGATHPIKYERGNIGFGSSKTPLEITDIKITRGGKTCSPILSKGKGRRGSWTSQKDTLRQSSEQGSSMFVLNDIVSNNFVLECRMKKSSYKEGFFLYYGLTKGEQKGFVYNVGCWNGNTVSVEQLSDGHNMGAIGKAVQYGINPYQWYNMKLVVTPIGSTLFIDGKKILSHCPTSMPEQFIASGIDEKRQELILKVINRGNKPYKPLIHINGVLSVEETGKVISLSSHSDIDENSFGHPLKIYPQEAIFKGFGRKFRYNFPPYSYTIMRIKIKNTL